MKRDLAILLILAELAMLQILAWPPMRWWSRDWTTASAAEPVNHPLIESVLTSQGQRVLLAPWQAAEGWPRWRPFTRRRCTFINIPTDQGWVTTRIPCGGEFVDWHMVAAELGAVVTLCALGLSWAIRRDRRRRALAPA